MTEETTHHRFDCDFDPFDEPRGMFNQWDMSEVLSRTPGEAQAHTGRGDKGHRNGRSKSRSNGRGNGRGKSAGSIPPDPTSNFMPSKTNGESYPIWYLDAAEPRTIPPHWNLLEWI